MTHSQESSRQISIWSRTAVGADAHGQDAIVSQRFQSCPCGAWHVALRDDRFAWQGKQVIQRMRHADAGSQQVDVPKFELGIVGEAVPPDVTRLVEKSESVIEYLSRWGVRRNNKKNFDGVPVQQR
jgi:hypothetical protein